MQEFETLHRMVEQTAKCGNEPFNLATKWAIKQIEEKMELEKELASLKAELAQLKK